jgi:C2 domain in Dock180 and Zizimin proteins
MESVSALEAAFEDYRNGVVEERGRMTELMTRVSIRLGLDLYILENGEGKQANGALVLADMNLMDRDGNSKPIGNSATKTITPFHLYKQYAAIERHPVTQPTFTSHSLFIDLKSHSLNSGELTELTFFVWDNSKKAQVTHSQIFTLDTRGVVINQEDSVSNHSYQGQSSTTLDIDTKSSTSRHSHAGRTAVTFTDITQGNTLSSLVLVVRVVKIGRTAGDTDSIDSKGLKHLLSKRRQLEAYKYVNVRRIVGYSCTHLSSLPITAGPDVKETMEYGWEVQMGCDEAAYAKFDWINAHARQLIEKGQANLNLQLALFGSKGGDLEDVVDKHSISSRTGLLNHIQPPIGTNAIYITLNEAILPSRKNYGKNVQCSIQARKSKGGVLSCISRGEPTETLEVFDSVVYHQTWTPFWNETIRLDLGPEEMQDAHLFLTFRHCAPGDSSEPDRNTRNFAFAFL